MKDNGSAVLEFTWLTVLLIVPFIYAMLAVFQVQRAAYGISAASVAAVQSFHHGSDARAAHTRAVDAARLTMADFGIEGAQITVRCVGPCHTPGSAVEAVVTVRQPLPLVPEAWGTSVAGIDLDATHTEPYGTYRATR